MRKNSSPPHPPTAQGSDPEKQEEEVEEEGRESAKDMKPQKRLCDFCGQRRALLYCRADSAKLCFSCDREVHSTNQLFKKHTRSFLCDSCDSSPSSILCSTESLVLCQNCDWEKHNNRSLPSVYERRPLEGFSGCPSASELLSVAGFDDLDEKGLGYEDGSKDGLVGSGLNGSAGLAEAWSDFLVWDTPAIVTLDDLIVPADSDHNFQAMGVPPLPKNRKAACGQHKDEVLRQLRELSSSDPGLEHGLNYSSRDVELLYESQLMEPKQDLEPTYLYAVGEHDVRYADKASPFQWSNKSCEAANQIVPSSLLRSYTEESCRDDCKDSVVGSIDDGQAQPSTGTEILPLLPKSSAYEVTFQDRESAISRYKEKKKTRRYDKHIRYESRKVRAESRIRIKGRFAKIDH